MNIDEAARDNKLAEFQGNPAAKLRRQRQTNHRAPDQSGAAGGNAEPRFSRCGAELPQPQPLPAHRNAPRQMERPGEETYYNKLKGDVV